MNEEKYRMSPQSDFDRVLGVLSEVSEGIPAGIEELRAREQRFGFMRWNFLQRRGWA